MKLSYNIHVQNMQKHFRTQPNQHKRAEKKKNVKQEWTNINEIHASHTARTTRKHKPNINEGRLYSIWTVKINE